VHSVRFASLHWPPAHVVHKLAPAELCLPAGQSTHAVDIAEAALCRPAEHVVHVDALAALNLPPSQSMHAPTPALLDLPAAQPEHANCAGWPWYMPAEHARQNALPSSG
jgi:hypothetical protein